MHKITKTKSKKQNISPETLAINERGLLQFNHAITNSLYQQSVFVTATRNQPENIANKILKFNP
jgi:hypothetical protein